MGERINQNILAVPTENKTSHRKNMHNLVRVREKGNFKTLHNWILCILCKK
jgi:hypothetical protein